MASQILHIDDDKDDTRLLQIAFEEQGVAAEIKVISNGSAAMEALKEMAASSPDTFPDLILLDLSLPRISGKELLAYAKSQPALCTIPIVVLSTSSAEFDEAECIELGATAYITKAATYDELLQIATRIQRLLSREGS